MTGVLIEQTDGLLALTLNRPGASNALSPDMVESLISAMDDASAVRCCVITGEGKNFCAGFDLSDLDDLSDGDLLHRFLRIETLLQTVHYAPFPVIAMAQGHTIGAGADLFATCTFRVAAPETKFRMPGWNFDLALGTRRLARLVGSDAARDMLINTKGLAANDALEIGLATDIKGHDQWSGTLDALVERCGTLSEFSNAQMLDLTTVDSRDADLAAIVRTAGRPGLKSRIQSYQQRVMAERAARRREKVSG